MGCETVNYVIKRGSTFRRAVMWSVEPLIYKAITGVPQLSPLHLTVVDHGLVDGWKVAISDVRGMTQLNIDEEPARVDEFHKVLVIDDDTIEINDINAGSFRAYSSGGNIRFYTPVDITNFTARMDIVDAIGGNILHTLSTDLGTIEIDEVAQTITLYISDTDTSAFAFDTAIFSLELEAPSGDVTELFTGKIKVTGEATTTET